MPVDGERSVEQADTGRLAGGAPDAIVRAEIAALPSDVAVRMEKSQCWGDTWAGRGVSGGGPGRDGKAGTA